MKAKVKTWLKNVENGKIKTFTEKVLNEIKDNSPTEGFKFNFSGKGVTVYELRNTLQMSHQTITSRISELHDEGLIKDVGQKEIDGAFYSVYMFVNDLSYRNRVIALRKHEKYLRWLKNANDYFEFMDAQTSNMISFEQEQNNL